VTANWAVARDLWRLRLADAEIGRAFRPGQFVMVRIAGRGTDPLLGRPYAIYDTWLDAAGKVLGYELVYQVVGRQTRQLVRLHSGDELEVWGPLGKGFELAPTAHLLLVAGGVGHASLLALARAMLGLRRYGLGSADESAAAPPPIPRLARQVTLCYGAQTRNMLAGVRDFAAIGVDVKLATDDGTAGHRGLVTELAAELLAGPNRPTRVVGCGPEPMLAKLAELARQAEVPCQLSLETAMACGIGACFGCVVRVRLPDGGWDYKRACTDGPVFDSSTVLF